MLMISYTVLDNDGFLTDKVAQFNDEQNALEFLRKLKQTTKVSGKPIIETKKVDENVIFFNSYTKTRKNAYK